MSALTNPLARWNERFSTDDYLFSEKPNQYLADKTALLQRGKALCIADGEGRNSVWLASQAYGTVACRYWWASLGKSHEF